MLWFALASDFMPSERGLSSAATTFLLLLSFSIFTVGHTIWSYDAIDSQFFLMEAGSDA